MSASWMSSHIVPHYHHKIAASLQIHSCVPHRRKALHLHWEVEHPRIPQSMAHWPELHLTTLPPSKHLYTPGIKLVGGIHLNAIFWGKQMSEEFCGLLVLWMVGCPHGSPRSVRKSAGNEVWNWTETMQYTD